MKVKVSDKTRAHLAVGMVRALVYWYEHRSASFRSRAKASLWREAKAFLRRLG